MFETIVIISTLFFFVLIYSLYRILKMYDKRSQEYLQEIEMIKFQHEKNLLSTQIEIQEQTFQNISREIHDNIGQKLSLAKLYLNTTAENGSNYGDAVQGSLTLITEVMDDPE